MGRPRRHNTHVPAIHHILRLTCLWSYYVNHHPGRWHLGVERKMRPLLTLFNARLARVRVHQTGKTLRRGERAWGRGGIQTVACKLGHVEGAGSSPSSAAVAAATGGYGRYTHIGNSCAHLLQETTDGRGVGDHVVGRLEHLVAHLTSGSLLLLLLVQWKETNVDEIEAVLRRDAGGTHDYITQNNVYESFARHEQVYLSILRWP